MIVREICEFKTHLPDDQVEEDGDIVEYGGEGMTVALSGILSDLGWTVVETEYLDMRGWNIYARKAIDVSLRVQSYHPDFHLGIYNKSKVKGYEIHHWDLLSQMNAALRADARFYDIQWKTRDDGMFDDAPGATEPLAEGERDRIPVAVPVKPWWKKLLRLD